MLSKRRTISILQVSCGLLALSISIPVSAQDAFNSCAEIGGSNVNVSNFTGSQTMQDCFAPELVPVLQGATNGTIGPQGDETIIQGVNTSLTGKKEDKVFHDGPLSEKDLKLRDSLIIPVACEEPNADGVFPPMPQTPALPSPDIGSQKVPSDPKIEKQAKRSFAEGATLARANKLALAGDKFDLAVTQAPDELQMRQLISAFLLKQAKTGGKRKMEDVSNLRRLAAFYDPSIANVSLLDECIAADGKRSSDVDYRASLARQFEDLGDFRLSVPEWRAVVKLQDSVSNHVCLISALTAAGCDREAIAELRRTVKLDWPENKKAEQSNCHSRLAEFFHKYSRYFAEHDALASSIVLLESAAMEARRAVVLNPADRRANRWLFQISLEAIAYCPKEVDNHMLLAACYLLRGDRRKAEYEYSECMQIDSSDPRMPIAHLALKSAAPGNSTLSPKEAVADSINNVEILIGRDPENIQLWRLLGRLYEKHQQPTKAKECFERATAIYWSAPPEAK